MSWRRRIWAAWRVLRGRPFDVAVTWGDEAKWPGGVLVIPALTVPDDDLILSVGTGDWLLDAKPFPWTTIGDWVLTFSDESATILTIGFPVRMAGASPKAEANGLPTGDQSLI